MLHMLGKNKFKNKKLLTPNFTVKVKISIFWGHFLAHFGFAPVSIP